MKRSAAWIPRLVLAALALTGLFAAASASATPASTHSSGTLLDGATWVADVPANWNGTLLLYSHGYGPLTAADAPDPTTQAALLGMGYAMAGSSYDPHGSWWHWAARCATSSRRSPS